MQLTLLSTSKYLQVCPITLCIFKGIVVSSLSVGLHPHLIPVSAKAGDNPVSPWDLLCDCKRGLANKETKRGTEIVTFDGNTL